MSIEQSKKEIIKQLYDMSCRIQETIILVDSAKDELSLTIALLKSPLAKRNFDVNTLMDFKSSLQNTNKVKSKGGK